MHRVARALVAAAVVAGCSSEPSETDVTLVDWGPPDGGPAVVGPDGALGVCCPPDPPGCWCTDVGGWAESTEACANSFGRRVCDAAEWSDGTDGYGCPILVPGAESCL